MKNITLVIGATFFWLMIAEVALRLVYNPAHISVSNAIMGEPMFTYDAELGWSIIPNSSGTYTASRTIDYTHNSMGMRESEIVEDARKRLLFLGDSFTWGFDVQQEERFTNHLKAHFPEYQIINAGVNGYGTDQQWLWYNQIEQTIKPDAVVLLYFGENDHVDNSTNMRHGGFYKPYFERTETELQLKGTPVPKGERYFYAEFPRISKLWLVRLSVSAWYKNRAEAKIYIEDPTLDLITKFDSDLRNNNIPFILLGQSPKPSVISLVDQLDLPFLDVSNSFRYETFGGHWTPEGHQFVADSIIPFLRSELDILN